MQHRGRWFARLSGVLLLLALPLLAPAQTPPAPAEDASTATIEALVSFIKLRTGLEQDIKALRRQIAQEQSEVEKGRLQQELDQLQSDLRTVTRNFEDVAAGLDISSLRAAAEEEFNFQKEVFALLRPAIDEMKEMTARVRQKSDLRERIAFYQERLPILEGALKNARKLLSGVQDEQVAAALRAKIADWEKQYSLMQGELRAAQLQLDQLLAAELSLAEASQNYLKSFFQRRGLYLIAALLVVVGIVLLSRLSYAGLQRYVPGFRAAHRNFRVRLIELLHRLLTLLLIVVGPMIVFYLVEDWVLFSLGVLLLLGIAWTLRQALPRYWQQVQIFLNVGAVREGERVFIDGLPWRVEQINMFSTLVNPVAQISQRLPLADLVDLKSRPSRPDEPWFPCRKGDWVILNDGFRGKVIGISQELVQLVERGGSQLTCLTGDFLAKAPRNLATNFRIKETLGISYRLQHDSTTTIPETLYAYVQRRLVEEGYGEQLVNLRVEFAQANTSSLDLVVIADFKGELGELYNRLRRAIQRWCVDACSEYGWEIPFPQLTLHGALAQAPQP